MACVCECACGGGYCTHIACRLSSWLAIAVYTVYAVGPVHVWLVRFSTQFSHMAHQNNFSRFKSVGHAFSSILWLYAFCVLCFVAHLTRKKCNLVTLKLVFQVELLFSWNGWEPWIYGSIFQIIINIKYL